MITFVVKRSMWLRGTGDGALRSKNGKQCCLGFIGRQCGIKAKDLIGKVMPVDVDPSGEKYPDIEMDWIEFSDINDDDTIVSERAREKSLKELAKEAGFRFKFID